MHCIRNSTYRLPQVYRIVPARNIHQYRNTMSLFPRFTQEFSPLFRFIDEYDRASRQFANNWSAPPQTFQPKFDVRETQTSYELHGELPGIEQKDVNIEWTDGNTIAITGRTEKSLVQGEAPTVEETTASSAVQAAIKSDASASDSASTDSPSNYHKPSIAEEDGDETSTIADETTANKAQLTPTTTTAEEVAKPVPSQAKYWVSERSIGQFHRSFSFPTRVDHESVKASLRNGILSIVIPKAKAPQLKRIQVE